MSLFDELTEISGDLICDMEQVMQHMEVLTESEALIFIKFLVDSIAEGMAKAGPTDETSVLASAWVYGFLIGREHGRRGYQLQEPQ